MDQISSIEKYTSSFSLCVDNVDYEEIRKLTVGEVETFKAIDDWQGLVFYLVNGNTVFSCDEITGDVVGFPDTVREFFHRILAYIREEMEEAR